jgi:hypothetical protein
MLGNKRACELHWELGKLPGQLAGGEHERRALAPCGGGNGGEEHAVVRGGEQAAFISSSGRPCYGRRRAVRGVRDVAARSALAQNIALVLSLK